MYMYIYTHKYMYIYTYTYVYIYIHIYMGFSSGSDRKESACNAGDPASSPGSVRSPGEGTGCPLQHSCSENSMHRGAWLATVHRVTKSQT